MKYGLSKYMDVIRPFPDEKAEKEQNPPWGSSSYLWFDSYEEAKQFCVQRAQAQVSQLKKEIKRLERKIPLLQKMTEKKKTK
jgi:hypothetical protein